MVYEDRDERRAIPSVPDGSGGHVFDVLDVAVPLYFGRTNKLAGSVGRAWGSIVLQLSSVDGGDATGFLDGQKTTRMVVAGMASESPFIGQPDFVGSGGIVFGSMGGGRSNDLAIPAWGLVGASVWLLCGGEPVFTCENCRDGSVSERRGRHV